MTISFSHGQYRFIAYRQLKVGVGVDLEEEYCVVMPSCAVNEIRTNFHLLSMLRLSIHQLLHDGLR